jgi:putative transcriptional regulator
MDAHNSDGIRAGREGAPGARRPGTTPRLKELIARRVRRGRVAAGLTQAELAERVGVSRWSITRLESGGTADPSTSLLERVARVLEVPVRDLVSHLAAVESDGEE